MKKLALLVLLFISFNTFAQITKSIDISVINGADTSFYFTKAQTAYSYSLGGAALFQDMTGTGGTLYFMTSPTDSFDIIVGNASGYVVNSDTVHAILDDVMPFEYIGFKYVKGSTTAGLLTYYISRKTRK